MSAIRHFFPLQRAKDKWIGEQALGLENINVLEEISHNKDDNIHKTKLIKSDNQTNEQ